uniref:Uncharacterized protein n=1 Tax=Arundo donax TaxID=35708 RepID=A0A0A9HDD5_ARUDO
MNFFGVANSLMFPRHFICLRLIYKPKNEHIVKSLFESNLCQKNLFNSLFNC